VKLTDLPFFQIASKRLQWLGSRQQVISQNVANADTPGYRSQEVASFAESVGSARHGVRTTNARHIAGSSGEVSGARVVEDAGAWEKSLDGNNVSLEQQSIKAAEVAENYRLAAQLYRKGQELVTLAVTGIR
jgi:flagellar basal-body rod protein FlgB